MNKFTYVDCTTVDQALDQLTPDATVKAGGIDLLDLMKDGIVTPPRSSTSATWRSSRHHGQPARPRSSAPWRP